MYDVDADAPTVRGSRCFRRVANARTSSPSSLMEREERIQLHDREIVPEEDERRDINDVAGRVPEMREELGRTSGEKPDHV